MIAFLLMTNGHSVPPLLLPPRDEMDLLAFTDFVLAWDHRSHPAAIKYFFDIFDLKKQVRWGAEAWGGGEWSASTGIVCGWGTGEAPPALGLASRPARLGWTERCGK